MFDSGNADLCSFFCSHHLKPLCWRYIIFPLSAGSCFGVLIKHYHNVLCLVLKEPNILFISTVWRRAAMHTDNARHTVASLTKTLLPQLCAGRSRCIIRTQKRNTVQHFNSLPAAWVLWKMAFSCMSLVLKWIHKSGISLSEGSASWPRWPFGNERLHFSVHSFTESCDKSTNMTKRSLPRPPGVRKERCEVTVSSNKHDATLTRACV